MVFKSSDILITHKDCMDGAACAIVFLKFGGNSKNIFVSPPGHNFVDKHVTDLIETCEGTLYLADVSVSDAVAKSLNKRDNVKLFDHHASALHLKNYRWCEIEEHNNRCGAKMLFDFATQNLKFSNDDYNDLLRLINAVDDRDRWIGKNSDAQFLADIFAFQQQQNFIDYFFKNTRFNKNSEPLKYIAKVQTSNRLSYTKSLHPVITEVEGVRIAFTYCDPRNISDAGSYIGSFYNVDLVVLISDDKISMRSPPKSSIDLSVIAKQFKGGGHKHAAGFSAENFIGQSTILSIMDKFRKYDFSNCSAG